MSQSQAATNPIVTHVEAKRLMEGIRTGASSVRVSLDLGLSVGEVSIHDGAAVIGTVALDRKALEKIAKETRKCFEIAGGAVKAISVFSETTGWVRTLSPTRGAPTTLVSGFPMHRIKDVDPMEDTRAKVRALGLVKGRVLDTAMGLGYTAIELAKTAREVVTVELAPAALEIARKNPWSQALFGSRIEIRIGDVFEVIGTFAAGEFEAVLHDPPTMQLAGELYSEEFYRKMHHVLRRGGRLFHYVGDPKSVLGAKVTQGVLKRLALAGFKKTERKPDAFGVLAIA